MREVLIYKNTMNSWLNFSMAVVLRKLEAKQSGSSMVAGELFFRFFSARANKFDRRRPQHFSHTFPNFLGATKNLPEGRLFFCLSVRFLPEAAELFSFQRPAKVTGSRGKSGNGLPRLGALGSLSSEHGAPFGVWLRSVVFD